ncbi:MAG: BatA domain-containing protein, partial [Chloroflexia bacterium]
MGILLPAALALLALAIPIIILYMLRLRREELSISSSMLWRRALMDRTANAPWQRLRRNLLLLLQLLLLLLLVLGLARPFVSARTGVAGNLVLVLDASASM